MIKYKSAPLLMTIIIIALFIIFGCEKELMSPEEANPFLNYFAMEIDPRTNLDYAVIFPETFNSDSGYPALLAFPPGEQTISQVQWGIDLYYIRQSIQRNWLVISPAAPGGIKFFEGSENYIPDLMEEIENRFNIEGGKYHLSGVSNGGVSAFRVAVQNYQKIQSLTVFPGVPLEQDKPFLDRLVDIPITMYVGALDDNDLIAEIDSTAKTLQELGVEVNFRQWANDGHVILSLTPDHLFDIFDGYRPLGMVMKSSLKSGNQ
jgi:hypothetical protein